MKTTTYNAFIEDYLVYAETIKGLSERTVEVYRGDLNAFFMHLAMRKKRVAPKDGVTIVATITLDDIKSVTYPDIYDFLNYAAKTLENSDVTRKRKATTIRVFYHYLTNKRRLLALNPVAELEMPKTSSRKPHYLELDEAMDLLKNIKGKHAIRDKTIITLFLNCGMRLNELTQIKFVDIKGDQLRIIGKGDKERTIYLNDACLAMVKDYLAIRESDSPYLFISAKKLPISNRAVQRLVEKHLNAAGLNTSEISVHKLRHTAATLMFKYGGSDVLTIKDILGHDSVSTTQIYTHVDEQQLREAENNHPLNIGKNEQKSTKVKEIKEKQHKEHQTDIIILPGSPDIAI